MSSGTSTERGPVADTGFRPVHLFVLLSMAAATAGVLLSRQTQPAALLLVSGAIVASGLVGFAVYRAVSGFLGQEAERRPLDNRARDVLEREKALVLRSIKELEFDRSMKKVGDADFADMSGRLRARALSLMQEIERGSVQAPAPPPRPAPPPATAPEPESAGPFCDQCGTQNHRDAKFCKQCGAKIR